jgi:hypothetical protein
MPAAMYNVDLKEDYSFVDSVPQTPLFVFNCVQKPCDISKLEFNIHKLRSMIPSVEPFCVETCGFFVCKKSVFFAISSSRRVLKHEQSVNERE